MSCLMVHANNYTVRSEGEDKYRLTLTRTYGCGCSCLLVFDGDEVNLRDADMYETRIIKALTDCATLFIQGLAELRAQEMEDEMEELEYEGETEEEESSQEGNPLCSALFCAS